MVARQFKKSEFAVCFLAVVITIFVLQPGLVRGAQGTAGVIAFERLPERLMDGLASLAQADVQKMGLASEPQACFEQLAIAVATLDTKQRQQLLNGAIAIFERANPAGGQLLLDVIYLCAQYDGVAEAANFAVMSMESCKRVVDGIEKFLCFTDVAYDAADKAACYCKRRRNLFVNMRVRIIQDKVRTDLSGTKYYEPSLFLPDGRFFTYLESHLIFDARLDTEAVLNMFDICLDPLGSPCDARDVLRALHGREEELTLVALAGKYDRWGLVDYLKTRLYGDPFSNLYREF